MGASKQIVFEKDEEPPPSQTLLETKEGGSGEIFLMQDLEGILLEPNLDEGESGVLNPTIHQNSKYGPWPFAYRVRRRDDYGEYSTIDLRFLETPTKLSKESRTIIKPEYDFEWRGCEDPIMTKFGSTYYITYVAWDGLNARVALATTRDFKEIKKHRVISPQMPLEEIIGTIKDKRYNGLFEDRYKGVKEYMEKKKLNQKIFPYDKDAFIQYDVKNRKWILFHRLLKEIQIAIVDKLEDLQNENFWRNYLKNIGNHVFMRNTEPWESDKIGLSTPIFRLGSRKVGIWHGFTEKEDECVYRASFFKLRKGSYEVESRIKNPLFNPDKDTHVCKYMDEKGKEKTKKIIFPRGVIKSSKRLFVYSGIADIFISYRSTSIPWIISELDHPNNRIRV